jgi:hexulose-6-phosphate isomerase
MANGATISRRSFLVSSTLVLAGATIAPRRPRYRKAVKLEMFNAELSILEKFQVLTELGFDGVELMSPEAYDTAEVVAARERSGLVVHGVVNSEHWRSPLSDPDAAVRARGRAALETALRDCKTYGGSTVLLVPAVVKRNVSYADAYRRSQDEIAKVLPLAESLGVRIAIENVWNNFLLSPLEAARYVDEFESPAIGWYFDVGNVVRYGWPQHWIRVLDKRILKLDIKEYSRELRDTQGPWKGFNVELGEGDCDWPTVRKTLAEIGYEGWATAEVRGGGRQRLAEISQRMDRVLGLT